MWTLGEVTMMKDCEQRLAAVRKSWNSKCILLLRFFTGFDI